MNEKYYKIGYGCGCGDNEDYIIAKDQKEADAIAQKLLDKIGEENDEI